ncbi:uncharacterized protein [Hyperolius riggenbachi]|uniref:uncharacterized protein isoform X2 n=1 Tax=Hyperolius riggenbachi TaxID=752182 RepID=UPI0035A336CA
MYCQGPESQNFPIVGGDCRPVRRNARLTQNNVNMKEEAGLMNAEKEEIPIEVRIDGLSNKNMVERVPSLNNLQDSAQEDLEICAQIPQDVYQVKEEVEVRHVMGDEPLKSEDIPIEIGSDGQYTKYATEKHPVISLGREAEGVTALPCGAGRVISCFKCSRSFHDKAELFSHEETHFPEKPYTCSECGKSYPQKCLLRRHQARHVGHKPFSCLVCGKCFVQKGELTCHEKTHSVDKIDRRGRPPKGTFRPRVAGSESVSIGTFLC